MTRNLPFHKQEGDSALTSRKLRYNAAWTGSIIPCGKPIAAGLRHLTEL
jgi:hypothetical protein